MDCTSEEPVRKTRSLTGGPSRMGTVKRTKRADCPTAYAVHPLLSLGKCYRLRQWHCQESPETPAESNDSPFHRTLWQRPSVLETDNPKGGLSVMAAQSATVLPEDEARPPSHSLSLKAVGSSSSSA